MKKVLIFLFIIGLLIAAGVLYQKGIIKTDWQVLSMILAAAAGPYTLIKNYFSRNNKKSDKILQWSKEKQKEEELIRARYEKMLAEREAKIAELEAKLMKLEEKMETLELEKQQVHQDVEDMSLEDKQNEFTNLFGA